jgi:hypothetical protein
MKAHKYGFLIPFVIAISTQDTTWTSEEDEVLTKGIEEHGARKWVEISGMLPDKTPMQAFKRWRFTSKEKRGRWLERETKNY